MDDYQACLQDVKNHKDIDKDKDRQGERERERANYISKCPK